MNKKEKKWIEGEIRYYKCLLRNEPERIAAEWLKGNIHALETILSEEEKRAERSTMVNI